MIDDLVSPLKAVCILDPAIDWSAGDPNEYVSTRDLDLIQAKPGMHLTVAVLRPLSVSDFAQLDSLSSAPAKLLQAFRLSCTAVENIQAPGVALEPMTLVRLSGGERRVWGDEELDALMRKVGVRFVYELGNVAYERAVQGNGWGGGVVYTLPRSSVDGLGQMRHQRVEQSQGSGGTDSSARSAPGSTTGPAPTSGGAGGAPAASGEAAPAGP